MLQVVVVLENAVRNRLLAALLDHLPPGAVSMRVVVAGQDGPLADQLLERGVQFDALGVRDTRNVPLLASRLRGALGSSSDVVHSHQFLPSAAVELTRRTIRPRPPSVMTRHHDLAHHLEGRRRHVSVDRWTARAADHVVAVSAAVERTLVDREGVDPRRVTVIPNGVDFDALRADDDVVRAWRDHAAGRRLAVAVGRLDPLKDYPLLLNAFALVREASPDVLLLVAGDGIPGARDRLQARIDGLGLADAVELLGWVDDIPSLVAAADVFVQSSRTEAAPQSILEAVGLDVPVVVTTPGGAAEVVHPWYEPLAPGDARAFAERVLATLGDPDHARRRAGEAGATVRERFSAQRMADLHLDVYRTVRRRR